MMLSVSDIERKTYPADNGKGIIGAISSLCYFPRKKSSYECQGREWKSYGSRSNDIGGVIPHDAWLEVLLGHTRHRWVPRRAYDKLRKLEPQKQKRNGEVLKRTGQSECGDSPWGGRVFSFFPRPLETPMKNGPSSRRANGRAAKRARREKFCAINAPGAPHGGR